jgi:hypothetical protein
MPEQCNPLLVAANRAETNDGLIGLVEEDSNEEEKEGNIIF